jgi:thiamine kinase-like enzyme
MTSSVFPNFPDLVQNFTFEGRYLEAEPFGCGHIHDTYAASFEGYNGRTQRYIVQRMNTHVFTKPREVMENIAKVTAHLRTAIQAGGGDSIRETLTLIPTQEGELLFLDKDGSNWRAMLLIEGAQTYQTVSDSGIYTQAALAFGRFQRQLADFTPQELHVTIPNFHNTPWRLENFLRAVVDDAAGRGDLARKEVDFLLQRKGEAGRLKELVQQGLIPERVTHNDTKLDNVLIDDRTHEAICVIDLDTVMPGLALYDFGDSVRSATNPVAEDEPDLNQVHFDFGVFRLLVQGYLAEMGSLLTPAELDNLAFASWLITYEQALRFLGDYLNGDTYYKISRSKQNLERARTQIRLIEGMEGRFEDMERVVEEAG